MADITQKMSFDASGAIKELTLLTDSINQANKALKNLSSNKGGAALNQVNKQAKEAKKSTEGFLISWKTMARILGTQIVVRGLNTVIQGLRDSVEQARLLGLAIEEVRTIDGAGRGSLNLTRDILALSDAIGKAPVDLAEGLYQTLSNQVVEAGEALNFTSRAAKLATVTASQTGDAVNALSSVMNSYGFEAGKAEHVAGTLFKTVELGRLRLNEIANVIGRVTPLTATLGIAWEEAAASLAVMTRQGVRADTAITQLRAVVTRLIKPTDEMRAIFRQWGVVDGKQAIATFGGLGGVLKKLSEETGSSSEGMAELLRNVRAISGQLGIMTDDGELLAQVMGEITAGSEAAEKAWSQFAESDAQRLTASMQEFTNQLTRLGTDNLPYVISAMEFLNDLTKVYIQDLKFITGNWGEAEIAAEKYQNAVQEGVTQGEELASSWADATRGAYDELRNASNLYYAEANKKEFALANVRDNSIKEATASLENSIDSITDTYKSALKQIEAFANDAAKRVASAFQKLADIRGNIVDQELAYRLDAEEDLRRQQIILEEERNRAIQGQEDAIRNIDFSEDSLKAVENANSRILDLDKQLVANAKDRNASSREIQRFTDQHLRDMEALVPVTREWGDLNQRAGEYAKGAQANFSDISARQKEIADQQKEIAKDGVVSKDELTQLQAMGEEMQILNNEAIKISENLRSFGLDLQFDTVIDGLEYALNRAWKDWDAEVARAQLAFANAIIPIKLAIDPGGVREQAAAALGIQTIEGEGVAARAGRIDAAAADLLEREAEIRGKINTLTQQGLPAMEAINSNLATAARLQQEAYESARSNAMARERNLHTAEGRAAAEEKVAYNLSKQFSSATQLQEKFFNVSRAVAAGQLVHAAITTELEAQTHQALLKGQIDKEQAALYNEITQSYKDRAALNEQINAETAKLPEREQVAAAQELNSLQRAIADSKLTEAEAAAQVEGRVRAYTESMEAGKTAATGMADETQRTGEEAGVAATNTAEIGTNASGSVGQTNALANAMGSVAAQTERAVAAQRALNAIQSSGTGPQTVANPFRADGGSVRGSDTVSASLTPGEMVVNKRSSRQFFSELNSINQGNRPVYREQGGSVTQVGDVNVTVNGGGSSQQTVREIGHGLRREIQRGNIKLR